MTKLNVSRLPVIFLSVVVATLMKAQEVVVYTALRPSNWDLYLFESPNSKPRRLTDDHAADYNAVFSPDGRWVVFCSERRGNPDLYALDLKNPGPLWLLTPGEAMEDAPSFSPDGRKLVFVSTRDGRANVFVATFRPEDRLPLEEAANLTPHPSGNFNPVFSPDGNWIAFSSDRDGYRESEIYVMRVDGSSPARLTHSAGWDGSPAWSADGELIYFYSTRDGRPRLYRMNADGSNQQPLRDGVSPALKPGGRLAFADQQNGRWLVFSGDEAGGDLQLESDQSNEYWAPAFDARTGRMVCHGTVDGPAEPVLADPISGSFVMDKEVVTQLPDRSLALWAVRGSFPSIHAPSRRMVFSEHFEKIVTSALDGGRQRVAFQSPNKSAWRPSWSKDGQWIACTVGPTFAKPGAVTDVWKFRANGSEAANLTGGSAGNNGFPDFSPDARQIVFRSGRDGNHEIYVMDTDGNNLRRLTNDDATDTMPAFSPDGTRIAFTSHRDGDYEIYMLALKPDSAPAESRRLTRSPGRDVHPAFSPDGKWIVFASERGGMNDESPLLPIFNPQPYGEIFALRVEDGVTVRLTHNKWEDGTPSWSRVGP